jgi:hypothetical protein
MAHASSHLPGRSPSSTSKREQPAGRHPQGVRQASKQALVEDAIARVFYGTVKDLARAAIEAIEQWETDHVAHS